MCESGCKKLYDPEKAIGRIQKKAEGKMEEMSLEEFMEKEVGEEKAEEREEETEEVSDPVERKLRTKLTGEELEIALRLLNTPVSKIRSVIRELIEIYEER